MGGDLWGCARCIALNTMERRRRGRSPSPERRRRGRSPSPERRRRRDDSPEHGEITRDERHRERERPRERERRERESEREAYLRRMRARERERDAQRRRSPSPDRRRKRRSPSPDRRPRPSALVSQYDDLFAGAEWYKGLSDGPAAQGGGEKGASASEERPASPEAGEVEPDEEPAPAAESVEELKHRLLFGFLSELPEVEAAPSAAAAAPGIASEPAASPKGEGAAACAKRTEAASDTDSSNGRGDESGVARSCEVSMPTAGTDGPAAQTAAGKVAAANRESGLACAPCEAYLRLTAGTDGAMTREPCGPSGPHGRVRLRTGKRWRLCEMGVRHVVKTLRALALEQYATAFVRHGVDGFMCDFLDEELLEWQLGMRHPEHRQRFLQWVERRNVFDEMLQKSTSSTHPS